MADTPRRRTVRVHGAPTDDDLPAIFGSTSANHHGVRIVNPGDSLSHPDTWWIPAAEVKGLPEAPPPPRTVTIELTESDALYFAQSGAIGRTPQGRLTEACRAARAKLDGAGDD